MELVTKDNFEEKVHYSDKPVVVDFYGEMCQPCKQLEPIMDKLSESYKDKAHFFRIEIQGNQEIFAEHGIASVPVIVIFKNGEPKEQLAGFQPEEKLAKWFDEHL